MNYNGLRSRFGVLATSSLAVVGSTLLFSPAAQAFWFYGTTEPNTADFETCTRQLLSEGVSEADALAACGTALHPEDVSKCVVQIANGTDIDSSTALEGCMRVRRPVETADCVLDIDSATDIAPQESLDYCRRSILPDRFSDCVVGISNEATVASSEILTACSTVSERPSQYLPNFETAPEDLPTRLTPLEPSEVPLETPLLPSETPSETPSDTSAPSVAPAQ